MKKQILFLVILLISFCSLTIIVPEYGIESAEAIGKYADSVFPNIAPASGDWELEVAFDDLSFRDPLALVQLPDSSSFFVAEKGGSIRLLSQENGSYIVKTALDISDRVIISGDGGLINIILHPEFGDENSANKGFLYAFYAFHPSNDLGEDPRINRLSRFTVDIENYEIDINSEYILIQDYDPHGFHMGGGMCFDNDGYFYISFGDGGDTEDGFDSWQQIDQRFWGGILRLDLDMDPSRSHPISRQIVEHPMKTDDLPESFTQGYFIPNDNPFISATENNLEEFYALGYRSPHRLTYDNETEQLYCGDVGGGKREEITKVKRGGNAQWPYREGKTIGDIAAPDISIGEENPPLYDYERFEGNSIIGGFVYRGDKWNSQLDGKYIFGDHGTRSIWSLETVTNEVRLMTVAPSFGNGDKSGISSFATDYDGEIYVLKLYGFDQNGGKVYKFKYNSQPSAQEIPNLLSETGVFTDLENLKVKNGFIPYDVNSPLWSDGAVKKRWLAVPNDGKHDSATEQISFDSDFEWQFPTGTVFVKHFELPIDMTNINGETKRLETRFYIIDDNGVGYGFTYQWLNDQSDAVLLQDSDTRDFEIIDELGNPTTQTWTYPSRLQCNHCHNSNAGFVLGVNSWQLNGNLEYEKTGVVANQIQSMDYIDLFDEKLGNDIIDNNKPAVNLESTAPLQEKVASYLASNCSSCHRPNGVEGAFDARFGVPLNYKNLINATGESHNNPEGGIIVIPGNHAHSQLWLRDASTTEEKMPPLGRSVLDRKWIETLAFWIDGLTENCEGRFISDLGWQRWPQNGMGKPEADMSNGGPNLGDGEILSVADQKFFKGIGVNAESEIIVQLEGEFMQLNTSFGVDDTACEEVNVRFEISLDGDTKFKSPNMTKGMLAGFVSIDLENANELRLKVKSNTDSLGCDYADWINTKLLKSKDSDYDGVCDSNDQCPGLDDSIDENNDGTPDGCDLDSKELEFVAKVYPNPTQDIFQILVQQPEYTKSQYNLRITDSQGRIYHEAFNLPYGVPYEPNAEFVNGIYYIHLSAGAYRSIKKIVVVNQQ
ncbi:NPCBM/NEW2 domain-containing protein [Saprospiraceae bacterium]|nr:NPCBM/NEW2 domain-containing protein [Saprospiraceae bacterium]